MSKRKIDSLLSKARASKKRKATATPPQVPDTPTLRKHQKTKKYAQTETHLQLQDNAIVDYFPQFFENDEAVALYDVVLKNTTWKHGTYNMYGKQVQTPRLLSCVADEDVSESYKVTESFPFTEELRKVKEKLEEFCDCEFKYAQMNYYRDGKDYIGYHCDSEVYEGDLIASVSLGTTRRFVLRHKKWKENETDKVEFGLQGGSLLLMKGDTQKHWKHTVPKEPKVTEGRINLTFRNR